MYIIRCSVVSGCDAHDDDEAALAQPLQSVHRWLLAHSCVSLSMLLFVGVVFLCVAGGKLFRTLQCLHEDGFVVVKAYVRRDKADFDAQLRRYEARLEELAARLPLSATPSLLNLVKLEVTERAAFLGRQYIGSNLVDRFHVHPALLPIEKRWLTYQMMHAVHQLHSHGVRHGDIKTENFLLTSWNWLFLVDVAFYKPTFLPSDNPADFNFFFENQGHTMGSHGMITQNARRRCYLAPERFYNQITDRKFHDSANSGALGGGSDGQVSEAMDVFSLGCVIAELFLSGESVLFDLPNLLAYREGSYDPTPVIARIPYASVRNLVHHMIQRDPAKRFSVKQYLRIWSIVGAGGGDEQIVPPISSAATAPATAAASASSPSIAPVSAASPLVSPSFGPLSSPASSPAPVSSPAVGGSGSAQLGGALFPPYFPYLYRFFAKLLNPELADPDIKIQALKTHQRAIIREVLGAEYFDSMVAQAATAAGVQAPVNAAAAGAAAPTRPSPPLNAFATPPPQKGAKLQDEFNKFKRTLEEKTQGGLRNLEQLQAEAEAALSNNSAATVIAGAASPSGTRPATAAAISQLQQAATAPSSSPGLHPSSAPSVASLLDLASARVPVGTPLHAPAGATGDADKQLSDFSLDKSSDSAAPALTYHGNGLTLITSIVCSCIQNVRYPITKLTALELLYEFGQYVDDEVRLGRLVPYAVALLSDPSSMVRATACHILTKLLSQVHSIHSASDAHLFAEFVFPALSRFPNDPEEIVRLAYAQSIAELATSSKRLLDLAQHARQQAALPQQPSDSASPSSLSQQQSSSASAGVVLFDDNYTSELSQLQDTVLKLIIDMLTLGGSRVKRALLGDITRLCVFMGRARVNNDLLPHLITVLNDRDFALRSAFFEYIVGVSVFVGRVAFQAFILPCVEQALFDINEFVIQRAVHALTALSQLGLFDKRIMVDISAKVGPLLCHPSAWIRHETIRFVASMASALGLAKSHVFLLPVLKPFMREPATTASGAAVPRIVALTQESLTQNLKPQLTREEFLAAVQAKNRSATTVSNDEAAAKAAATPVSAARNIGGGASSNLAAPAMVAESYAVSNKLMESAANAGMSWIDSGASVLQQSQRGAPSRQAQRAGQLQDIPEPDSDLSNSLSSADDDRSSISGSGSGSALASSSVASAAKQGSGFKNDPVLFAVMSAYLDRVSAAIQTKSQQPSASSSSQSGSGVDLSGAGLAGSSLEQMSVGAPSLLLRGTSVSAQALQSMDEDSMLIELQNLSLSTTLEEQVPLHQLDIERTMPEVLVVGPHSKEGGVYDRNNQADLFDSPSSAGPGAMGGAGGTGAIASDPSKRVTVQASPSRGLIDPSLVPRASSTAAASANTAGATAQGGHPIALKESLSSVPDYVKRALGVPLPPPQLGALKTDWISYSSFYKNHPVLDSAAYPYADSVDPKLWRPKGVLVATLAEHKAAVNALAVSRDNLFLVSGGEEGIVKIWDSGRLKLTAHARSQLSYQQQGRIMALTVCDSSHSVASASSNGSLHVFKVEYAGHGDGGDGAAGGSGVGSSSGSGASAHRYQGLSEVKRFDPDPVHGEGSMLQVAHFNTLTESLLVYATQKAVHGWDLRSRREAFELKLEPSMGVLTALALGPTPYCLMTGTSRGFIAAWDLRFQIPVQLWRHSAKTAITHLTTVDAPAILPRDHGPNALQHPVKGPLVFAAAEGTNQICGFDIYTGESRMLFRINNSTEQSGPGSSANRRESTAVGAGAAASNSSAYPMRSRQKVHVSPLSLPSLRSYIRESGPADRIGGGSSAAYPPAYSASSGFYHSLLGVTLDDSFLREFSQMGSPEPLLASNSGAAAPASIRSFLLCKESFALTAGTDKVVRFWDMRDPADSYRSEGGRTRTTLHACLPFRSCSGIRAGRRLVCYHSISVSQQYLFLLLLFIVVCVLL